MPPFGSEPSEKAPKALSFLSLSDAHKRPCRKSGPSRAFGAESSEQLDVDSRTPSRSAKLVGAPKRSLLPFRDEFEEEPHFKTQRKIPGLTASKPFQDEPESQCSSDDGAHSETEYDSKSKSVFSLGWQSMMTLQKAGFWKENQDDENTVKKKRPYDNTKRREAAMCQDKGQQGVFKSKGSDEVRLQTLLRAPTCHCAINANRYNLSLWNAEYFSY